MVMDHKPPSATQSCREARQISLQVGKFLFGVHGGRTKSLWFNLSSDIIYWNKWEFKWDQFVSDNHQLTYVENVAIDCTEEDDCFHLAHDMVAAFPQCKNLLVVLPHKPLPLGDVGFFHINDNEEVFIKHIEGLFKWQYFKWELEASISDMPMDDDEDGLLFGDVHEIPRLHAVEVVPIRTRAYTGNSQ
ncbi:hypothetical protein FHETE_1941 [Fusarium heterosporum]|uniref:Uncharacterized protein n=1 Tax=Fusarium heterosporum TaxID=42747 RepID=A0A8H5TXG7_FUSHE|nr:hypothetical protein FHETE_1941 [Fusarium heterosporum]